MPARLSVVLSACAALAAAVALTQPAQAAAADSQRTLVIGDCQHATYEPRKVISACADVGVYAVVKHYDSWTRHQARGSGKLVMNDCQPDCASGHFHRYPATFGFRKVVRTESGRVFSQLGVTYVKNGEQHNLTLDLPTSPV